MYIRVNGALIFARGGSMVPMEELDGWLDADAHVAVVKSAVQGNMNTGQPTREHCVAPTFQLIIIPHARHVVLPV